MQPVNGSVQLDDIKTFFAVLMAVKEPQGHGDSMHASGRLSNELMGKSINMTSQLDKIGK